MSPLILRDRLAIDRTHLANERTFLAYFRTFIVFVSSGIAIVKLDVLEQIRGIGYALTAIGPIVLIIGLYRLFYVKSRIQKLYKDLE